MEKGKVSFENIFEQNERRIYYHINKLNIKDVQQEFYQEGLVAMWNAYETYQPDKGPLATYFNYIIRNRMIDLMRKNNREQEKQDSFVQDLRANLVDGNTYRSGQASYPLVKESEVFIEGPDFWKQVKEQLSDNQWKWVKHFIIEDMSVKDIAAQEVVTVDAVKSWGREARRKLRD